MIFSRVSIDFEASHPPSSTLLLINDEVGDAHLRELSDEEINRLGYFRLADTSPYPGAFSSTITSVSTQNNSYLPNSPPPIRLKRTQDSPSTQLSKPEFLRISPSWATEGLCIDGFSSTAAKGIVSGESLGDITNSPLSISTDHDDFSSPSSSFSDRFVFPPSPDFEIPSPHSPFGDGDDDDPIFPNDFAGVFYVGYPLRPSQAHYNLVGLGLPGNLTPDNRRETFGELELTSPHPDEFLSSIASPLRSNRGSSISRSFSYLNHSIAISKYSRELYIIAEEDNEDWETPRSLSLPCIFPVHSQLSGSSGNVYSHSHPGIPTVTHWFEGLKVVAPSASPRWTLKLRWGYF